MIVKRTKAGPPRGASQLRILYISCNPLALKSDIESLGEGIAFQRPALGLGGLPWFISCSVSVVKPKFVPGFEVVALAIFDMFPYTTHAAAWTNCAEFTTTAFSTDLVKATMQSALCALQGVRCPHPPQATGRDRSLAAAPPLWPSERHFRPPGICATIAEQQTVEVSRAVRHRHEDALRSMLLVQAHT